MLRLEVVSIVRRRPRIAGTRRAAAVLSFVSIGFLQGASAQEAGDIPLLESYPDHVQALVEQRDNRLLALPSSADGPLVFELVLEVSRLWNPGATITVAFNGGDPQLHRRIAEVATEWTNYGNLRLDFGYNPQTGTYRAWTANDTSFAADVRISFDSPGYWSMVGRDSVDVDVSKPAWPSMNLAAFDRSLPPDWARIVRHEFGHALGAHHEHQHPAQGCDSEWRWDNDLGYTHTTDQLGRYVTDSQGRRPGLYTVLAGYPNHWPKAKVDYNLRQLADERAFRYGEFDRQSIMKYWFPPWMFKNGEQSQCYTGKPNSELSTQDRQSFAAAYPRQADAIRETLQYRSRILRTVPEYAPTDPELTRKLRELERSVSDLLE